MDFAQATLSGRPWQDRHVRWRVAVHGAVTPSFTTPFIATGHAIIWRCISQKRCEIEARSYNEILTYALLKVNAVNDLKWTWLS